MHFFSSFYLRYRQRITKTSPKLLMYTAVNNKPVRVIPPSPVSSVAAPKMEEPKEEPEVPVTLAVEEEAEVEAEAEQPGETEVGSWETDPISRERLSSTDEAGIRIGQQIYHVPTLLEYLATTDDLRDPVSRCPFSHEELEQLDAKAQLLGLRQRAGSLSGRSPEEEKVASSEKCRRKSIAEELLSLETVLGEVVVELLALVEQDQQPALLEPQSVYAVDAAQFTQLSLTLLFSQFEAPFSLLKLLDSETAYFNLCSYKQFLRGNPKKPRIDGPHRCISTITTWLDSFWSKEDQRALEARRG